MFPQAWSSLRTGYSGEALTNTLRHAFASRVWVFVRRRESELEVEVLDDGAGQARRLSPTGVASSACASASRSSAGSSRRAGGGRRLSSLGTVPDVIRVLLADDQALVRSGTE